MKPNVYIGIMSHFLSAPPRIALLRVVEINSVSLSIVSHYIDSRRYVARYFY